jgi:hypothetical protein
MNNQLWIEPVGKIIIARMRGIPTEELLRECQERILSLVQDTGQGRILHDVLEMEAPAVEVPLSQWQLDKSSDSIRLRRAIVVPNSRLAYLARLAFGEGDYRVFYNDMDSAVRWLSDSTALPAPVAALTR